MEQLAIEKRQWKNYFNSFNKRNHSRLVKLEVSDETGNHQTVKKMPLSGVSLDKSGVEIMLENRRFDEEHYTHIVQKPKNIIKDISFDGLNEILVIVDESGYTTRLSFDNLPELNV
ncbi:MAG: DUF5335 family protein [Acidobacteriota bacterium]